jgi:hypothetical protein
MARVGLVLLAVAFGVAAPVLGLHADDLFSRASAAALAVASAACGLHAALLRR